MDEPRLLGGCGGGIRIETSGVGVGGRKVVDGENTVGQSGLNARRVVLVAILIINNCVAMCVVVVVVVILIIAVFFGGCGSGEGLFC